MTIELDENTARMLDTLRTKASARQMPLHTYLQWLLHAGDTPGASVDLSVADFDRLLDELSSPALPTLPADFSRRDIYAEHD
jgi:hypothetical protein